MNYIEYSKNDIVRRPLWFHTRNVMQTSTEYGSKLATDKMLKYNNHLYRIYCKCFSNCGSIYIIIKKKICYINDYPND